MKRHEWSQQTNQRCRFFRHWRWCDAFNVTINAFWKKKEKSKNTEIGNSEFLKMSNVWTARREISKIFFIYSRIVQISTFTSECHMDLILTFYDKLFFGLKTRNKLQSLSVWLNRCPWKNSSAWLNLSNRITCVENKEISEIPLETCMSSRQRVSCFLLHCHAFSNETFLNDWETKWQRAKNEKFGKTLQRVTVRCPKNHGYFSLTNTESSPNRGRSWFSVRSQKKNWSDFSSDRSAFSCRDRLGISMEACDQRREDWYRRWNWCVTCWICIYCISNLKSWMQGSAPWRQRTLKMSNTSSRRRGGKLSVHAWTHCDSTCWPRSCDITLILVLFRDRTKLQKSLDPTEKETTLSLKRRCLKVKCIGRYLTNIMNPNLWHRIIELKNWSSISS